MVEWITIAAPWSIGFEIIGDAVLSIISGIPNFLPISETSPIGKIFNLGLGSVSP